MHAQLKASTWRQGWAGGKKGDALAPRGRQLGEWAELWAWTQKSLPLAAGCTQQSLNSGV